MMSFLPPFLVAPPSGSAETAPAPFAPLAPPFSVIVVDLVPPMGAVG